MDNPITKQHVVVHSYGWYLRRFISDAKAKAATAIVSWKACLDPCAEHIEVDSSHTGMSVNLGVYRVLAEILDGKEPAWTG